MLAKLVSALTVHERRRSSASRNSSLAQQTMLWIFRRCEQFLLQRRSRNDRPRRPRRHHLSSLLHAAALTADIYAATA